MTSALERLAQAVLDGRVRVHVWPHTDSTGRPLGGHRIEVRVEPPSEAPEPPGIERDLPRRDDDPPHPEDISEVLGRLERRSRGDEDG